MDNHGRSPLHAVFNLKSIEKNGSFGSIIRAITSLKKLFLFYIVIDYAVPRILVPEVNFFYSRKENRKANIWRHLEIRKLLGMLNSVD